MQYKESTERVRISKSHPLLSSLVPEAERLLNLTKSMITKFAAELDLPEGADLGGHSDLIDYEEESKQFLRKLIEIDRKSAHSRR